jgi:tRNA modification GTPase
VIAGQPNAGKSSLLNALAGAEVAIVTAIPGTTRDVLTQTLHIEGVPLHVLDTAGLRDAAMADEVEQIGMQRAWAQIADADIVLLLKDLSLEADEEYVRKQTALDKKIQTQTGAQTRVIRVSNKADLAPASVATHANGVNISAKTGWGMQELRAEILKQAGGNASLMEGVFTARTRHIEALKNVETHLTLAPALLAQDPPPLDIVAEECRLAQQALSQITGELTADDLLGEIFSRFCIGK